MLELVAGLLEGLSHLGWPGKKRRANRKPSEAESTIMVILVTIGLILSAGGLVMVTLMMLFG